MFLGICGISIAQALVNSERTTDRTISRKSSHQIIKYTSLNLDSFVLKGGNRATLGSAWSQGHLLLQWATCPYDEANWCWSRWLQMAITVPLILGICAYILMVYRRLHLRPRKCRASPECTSQWSSSRFSHLDSPSSPTIILWPRYRTPHAPIKHWFQPNQSSQDGNGALTWCVPHSSRVSAIYQQKNKIISPQRPWSRSQESMSHLWDLVSNWILPSLLEHS